MKDFSDLVGHLLFAVHADRQADTVSLVTTAGVVTMRHDQDCCEGVILSEVSGEGAHPGVVIRLAEDRTTGGDHSSPSPWGADEDSWTATWYAIRTDGDDIDAHWQGAYNGYYLEHVGIYVDPLTVEHVEALPPDARVSLDRWLGAGGVMNVAAKAVEL